MKIVISIILAFFPLNFLRIFFLNHLFNYEISKDSIIGFGTIVVSKNIKIKNSKIGIFNLINVENFYLEDSNISNFNLIRKFKTLKCYNNSLIGSYNKILGNNLQVGDLKMNKSQFTTSHLINVNNEFNLDQNVVFGGKNSLINIGKNKEPTIIGKNVYFGSSIYLNNGVNISEKVLVGSGSVVTTNIDKEGLFVSHRIVKI